MRVLIADDDPLSCRLLEGLLSKWGYSVETVSDGVAASAILESRDGPRLVLLDWMMPGLSGPQLCSRLRSRPNLPYTYVLLVTSRAQREDVLNGLEAGADDYITKPVDPQELRARMRVGTRVLELQEGLLSANQLSQSLVQSSPHGIVLIDGSGRVLDANPAFLSIVGCGSAEELRRDGVESMIGPTQELYREFLRELRGAGTASGRVMRWNTARGATVTVRVSGSSVASPGSGLCNVYEVIVEDITEQRLLEEQLHTSQKMEAIGRLSGSVAHDFNNVLMVIRGYAEQLEMDSALSERHVKKAQQIIKASDRASSLTRQLLVFSRRQVVDAQPLELNAVVADMEEMVDRLIGEDVELVTSYDPRVQSVIADAGQIEQVIMNLVVNAREAMPKGGRLTIATELLRGAKDSAMVDGAMPEEVAAISISDTGCGMDEATRARMFEPFFTTKPHGTGLGLATVYGIVTQCGGKIFVSSASGVGTTFRICLAHLRNVAQTVAADQPQPIPCGSESILLVEDEQSVRSMLTDTLAAAGYHVLEAGDAEQAFAVASRHPRLHAVVTDIVMPGMNGLDFIRLLRQDRPQLAIVLMSGYTELPPCDELLGEGRVAYLQKPFTTERVTSALRRVLDGRRPPPMVVPAAQMEA